MAESDFDQLELASSSTYADFVPVVFATTPEEAGRIRALLERCDIPTLIETETPEPTDAPNASYGIPVLVPTEVFDEATEILAVLDDDEDEIDEDTKDEDDVDDDLDDDYDDEDDDDDDFDDEDDEDFFDDDDEDDDL